MDIAKFLCQLVDVDVLQNTEPSLDMENIDQGGFSQWQMSSIIWAWTRVLQ